MIPSGTATIEAKKKLMITRHILCKMSLAETTLKN